MTYFSHSTLPDDNDEHRMAVGKFWMKRVGEWFIRDFSGTFIK